MNDTFHQHILNLCYHHCKILFSTYVDWVIYVGELSLFITPIPNQLSINPPTAPSVPNFEENIREHFFIPLVLHENLRRMGLIFKPEKSVLTILPSDAPIFPKVPAISSIDERNPV